MCFVLKTLQKIYIKTDTTSCIPANCYRMGRVIEHSDIRFTRCHCEEKIINNREMTNNNVSGEFFEEKCMIIVIFKILTDM